MAVKKKKKVSTKKVLKKKYDTATIWYGEDKFWTFKLSEWTLYIEYDWVEAVKNDGTDMEMFAVANVTQISYSMNTLKEVSPKADIVSIKGNDATLKPIA
jgi:hypothetical protein